MKKLTIISLLLIVFSSCNYFIAPPYTEVSKITELEQGMSIKEVNDVLDIKPYDVYYIGKESSILVYNYRQKKRKQEASGDYEEFIHSERSQKGGMPYYREEGDKLYVSFNDGKMSSLVTDNGREHAEFIMLTNNNLRFITEDNLMSLQKQSQGNIYLLNDDNEMQKIKSVRDSSQNKSVIVPLTKKPSKEDVPQTEKEESSGDAIWWTIGGAGALTLLLLLISG